MVMDQSHPYNFLALDEELSSYASARAVVLPVPYEATVTYGVGTRMGPQAIINASRQIETYDYDFRCEPCRCGIATSDELDQVVSSPKDMMNRIERKAAKILDDGKFLLTLGGEHSISYPLVKAHHKRYPEVSVLHIDAHTDLRDEYQGSKFSHACVMSRIAEVCDFVSVGVRSFSGLANERKAIDRGRIITASDFHHRADIVSLILSMLSDDVYISFDLDGFDPTIMPAVGTPEPGGLLWEETIVLLNEVSQSKCMVGADVVELAPVPGLIHPDFTAAKLAYKIIALATLK